MKDSYFTVYFKNKDITRAYIPEGGYDALLKLLQVIEPNKEIKVIKEGWLK